MSSLLQVPSREFRQRRNSGLQYVVSQPTLGLGDKVTVVSGLHRRAMNVRNVWNCVSPPAAYSTFTVVSD